MSDAKDDLAPLRAFIGDFLRFPDDNAVAAVMFAKGNGPMETKRALAETCKPGGRADQLAAELEDPAAARRFVRALAAKFAPFADVLRAVLPTGGIWLEKGQAKKGLHRHVFTPAAEVDAQRKNRAARAARFVMSFDEAAKAIGIKRAVVKAYIQKGKLDAVYHDGKKRADGVTKASVTAYLAYLRECKKRHDAIAARREQEARDRDQRATVGLFYTETGARITGAERMSLEEAAAVFGLKARGQVTAYANDGKIERVFGDENRHHAMGYLRESVTAYAAERATRKTTAVYFTAAGKIVAEERMSRAEAAAALHVRELTVTSYARAGQIVRAYSDPLLVNPCGFTRASVAKFLQDHPQHIPAKRAVAVEDFKIEVLPPTPRSHGLRAARLEPADDTGTPSAETPVATPRAERKRHARPSIVFMLHTTQEKEPQTMSETEPTQTTAAAQTTAPADATNAAKLQVAKAYTVHEAGVIRAICVSEADRDEIVAALALYRKAKAAPGEIESALALYRNARKLLGIEPPPDDDQPTA